MFETLQTIRIDPCLRAATRTQQQALVRVLAMAADQRVPLAPLLSAYAQDETGSQRSRIARLAELVAQGTSLADAVEQVPGVLPPDAILAIRFGTESGTMVTTLRSFIDHVDSPFHDSILALRDTARYALIVLIFACLMMLFLQVRVVPMYTQLLEDYGADPPWVFQMVWGRSGGFAGTCYLLFAAILLLAVPIRLGFFRRSWTRGLLARLGRPFVDLRTSRLLRHLGVALEAGRPLASSVSTLARYHPDPALRNQLLFMRNEMEQGADAWTSMASARLVSSAELQVLESAARTGNPAWALRDISQRRQDRMGRRLAVGLELLRPTVVIALGLMIGLIAVSLFIPVVKIIQYLA